ncbi:ABC transporter ATP-binding protein [Halobacteria archaeon AArc-curdl1]|uniref:Nickel import system ATP-binding protein NikD n=1 Tax=Natronosalvus hydrolyticus TaxID=2979988 RepID=A0AAP3E6L9_9EURY|nr:ABC transporter ATP-binding protein [Halobacteria archaeon AArc-curdl1]
MARLSVTDLSVTYRTGDGDLTAVDRVTFDIQDNEIFGIVGESGCGKSTLGDSFLQLLDENGSISGGSIVYDGMDLAAMTDRELADEVRGNKISMIFQDPNASLDPVYTVGQQLVETITKHLDMNKKAARERAIELLDDVGIPDPEDRIDNYPHSFSGGQLQRIVIAIALSCEPGLLIADEPTTGLDVSIQAQILDLLEELAESHETSIVMITHDLGVVAEICDRVGVMYAGNMVEIAPIQQLFDAPRHPYTQALLDSIPERHGMKEDLTVIPGHPPDLRQPPTGCRYNPRCDQVCGMECETGDVPPTYDVEGTDVMCYLYDEGVNEAYEGPTNIVAEPGGDD